MQPIDQRDNNAIHEARRILHETLTDAGMAYDAATTLDRKLGVLIAQYHFDPEQRCISGRCVETNNGFKVA